MFTQRTGWTLLVVAALIGCESAQTRVEPPEIHIQNRISVSNVPDARARATGESLAGSNAPRWSNSQPVANPEALTQSGIVKVSQTEYEPAVVPPSPGGESATNRGTGMPVSLDLAIATSLDRNPVLTTARAAEPVAEAALDVAKTYPWNPYVQLEVLPLDIEPGVGQEAIKHYVLLMQTLELAHQQCYREQAAVAGLNQVRWNVVQAEVTNTATTERLFFTALYQKDLYELARRTARLNQDLFDVVERRFRANTSTAGDLTTARVSARQSRKQAELAETTYQTAVLALRRQMNTSGDQPIELIGSLDDFHWQPVAGTEGHGPDFNVPIEVAASLAAERPDVRAAQSAANMAQANAALARANMVQNIQIGPYYERDELGTYFLGLRAQVNIPVWDTGRPLARQREAESSQQGATFQQLLSRAEVEAQTAIARYERARRLAAAERPQAAAMGEELARIQQQFAAGQVEILSVFTVQNTLLQERKAYLDLLNEVAQAAADVTLMTGLPPARLATAIPASPAKLLPREL